VLFGRTGLSPAGSKPSASPFALDLLIAGVTIAQLLTFTTDRVHDPLRRARRDQSGARGSAQTLRASRGRVFRTVTWPLLRPALAAAFLLGFVESLADFGNPIVLAGNFDVLSVKIFSPSPARSTTRAAPRCSQRCCSV
jgi:iron(III) transport system permease protein